MSERIHDLFSFGAWLRQRRKALDLTQAALAERVGCAAITIRKLEADVFRPSREIAERLAACLQIPAEEQTQFLLTARGERSVDRLAPPITQLDRLSSVERRLTHGAQIPLDAIPDPMPLPAGSRMPLSRNLLFVGRDMALREVAQVLHVGKPAALSQVEIAAATGLGGIGKTQLACEFVHRYGQFFAGGVFWLSFADPTAVPAEVAACGGSEGMHLSADFGMLPLDEQVRQVLTAWESELPRLLVFDNCEDEALLDQWRPKYGGCRVLITSRRHHWDPTLGVHAVALDVLPRADSLAMLCLFRPDLPADDADLLAIADALGDLPLALHLAGSFLAKYRHAITPAQYLARLQAPTLLDDRSLRAAGLSPTRHVQHVARTFEQSYARLDGADPIDALALTLLAHAACFAPGEPLPRSFLLQTLALAEAEMVCPFLVEDTLTRLIDLGLVETDDTAGSLRLHRLLVAFVHAVRNTGAAQMAVEATILRVADDLNEQRHLRSLLTIQPHLRHITEVALPRADARAAALCNALGYHLWQLGVYPEAQHYQEQALAIRQRVLGPGHPDTATSLNHLGNALGWQGQYRAAQNCHEQALAIRQRVLGPDHPDTARSLNNLGMVLQVQGEYAAAQDYFEQALAIRQRVLGPDHPDTARTLRALGELLRVQGAYAQAHPYLERSVAIFEQRLGPQHPDTAGSLTNLGVILKAQGQDAQAQHAYEQALAICERVLGPEHPDTARSLRGLGELFHAHGARGRPGVTWSARSLSSSSGWAPHIPTPRRPATSS